MLRCLIIKPITPLLRNATVQNGGISVGFSLIFTTRRAVQGVAVLLPVTMPQPLPTMKVWQAAARRPESSTDLLAMRGCRPKIGRASCRERGEVSGGDASWKRKM